jgi:phosphopantothenoylcysteine decarboxylase
MNILLGVTGSVAAIRVPQIINELKRTNNVQVVATKAAFHFWDAMSCSVPVWRDSDEFPQAPYKRGDRVLHIELRKWADVMVVAPLTAHTLARLSHGFADDLLTSVIRAWERDKPIVIAPAMNTEMWSHPATQEHIDILNRWYRLTIVNPVSKLLACGDEGIGGIAETHDIIAAISSLDA